MTFDDYFHKIVRDSYTRSYLYNIELIRKSYCK